MAERYDFQNSVVIRPRTRCWVWIKTLARGGYAQVTFNGKVQRASRLSYCQHNGPIPPGLVVMHSCDNPKCVNHEHLEAGTQQRNIQDCHRRGRASFNLPRLPGVRNPMVKLSEDAVRAIRMSDERQMVLARLYGVSQAKISQIRLRQAWRHIP